MRFDPEKHHRHSIRLPGYDYGTSGAYFVTLCVQNRECLFGNVVEGEMQCNDFGHVVRVCWEGLPHHYPQVQLDAFIIMPNHFHGILELTGVGAGLKPAPTGRHGLPEIIRGVKTFSARRINEIRNTPGVRVWQRNYYEHIIRNEEELDLIRLYVQENPLRWEFDRENPTRRNPLLTTEIKNQAIESSKARKIEGVAAERLRIGGGG